VATVIEVADPSARIEFGTQAELHPVWAYRNNEATRGETLLQAVRATYLPEEGEGYVWAAGEAATMRAIRYHLCTERGVDKSRGQLLETGRRGRA